MTSTARWQLAVVMILVAAVVPADAVQKETTYVDLVTAYREGRIDEAVDGLSRIGQNLLREQAQALMQLGDTHLLEAAVMLHTEAFASDNATPLDSVRRMHLGLATSFIDGLLKRRSAGPSSACGTWS